MLRLGKSEHLLSLQVSFCQLRVPREHALRRRQVKRVAYVIRTAVQQSLGYKNSQMVAQLLLVAVAAVALAFLPLAPVAIGAALVAGAILLLRRPWWIWLGIALLLPFTSAIGLGPLSLTDLAVATALLLWLADGTRQGTLSLKWSPILLLLCAYIGALFISALRAEDLGEAAAEVVKWIQVLVVIIVIRQMVPAKQAHWVVAALIAGAVAQSLLGLYQFIYRIGPEWFMILGRFMRASGSFGQPNPFAGYLGLILPVAASLSIWSFTQLCWGVQRGWQRLAILVMLSGATLCIGAAMLASWSRGGWLGAAAALAMVVALRSRATIAATATAILVVLVLVVAGSSPTVTYAFDPEGGPTKERSTIFLAQSILSERFTNVAAFLGLNRGGLTEALKQPVNDDNFAIIERLAHWAAALRMWSSAPWFGVGAGNYATRYPAIIEQDLYLMRWVDPLGHAHNIYLNVLAESGVVGLVTYLLLWIVMVVWLWKRSMGKGASPQAAAPSGWNYALAIGVIGVIVHLSIHNVVDNLFVQGNYLLIGFWIGLVSSQK